MCVWTEKTTNKEIKSITDFPEGIIGFVYLIEYTDGTKYVGKKNIHSHVTLSPLKSGEVRPNAKKVYTIGTGQRQYKEVVTKESNWKKYKGSHTDCKKKTPKIKLILDYAYTKLDLTYLEVKHQFQQEVLEHKEFINSNILGKFFKDKINN